MATRPGMPELRMLIRGPAMVGFEPTTSGKDRRATKCATNSWELICHWAIRMLCHILTIYVANDFNRFCYHFVLFISLSRFQLNTNQCTRI